MNQLEYIHQVVDNESDKRIMFDTPLVVKSTPHTPVFTCWGATIGPDGVYLMDYEQQWHGPLHRDQAFAPLVIASVYQRLKGREITAGVVVATYDNEVNATIVE